MEFAKARPLVSVKEACVRAVAVALHYAFPYICTENSARNASSSLKKALAHS